MAKKGVRIIDRDKGYQRLKREVKRMQGKPHVQVGWFGPKGSKGHPNSSLSIAEIMTVHEFGLGNSPERAPVRTTVDEKRPQILKAARKGVDRIARGVSTTGRELALLGLFIKGEIQQRIAEGLPPPNAASTVKRKGSSVPLIDTGVSRAALDFEVKGA